MAKKKKVRKKLFISRLVEKKAISGLIKKYGPKAVEALKPLLVEAIKGSIKYYIEEEMRKQNK